MENIESETSRLDTENTSKLLDKNKVQERIVTISPLSELEN